MKTIKNRLIRKIETLYWHALHSNKWNIALHALHMLAKSAGLFKIQRLPDIKRIADMNEEELTEFIEQLEKMDPELKELEEEHNTISDEEPKGLHTSGYYEKHLYSP